MSAVDDVTRDAILARLRAATSQEEEEEIGRIQLSSFLHRASPEAFDAILKQAKRDNRLRRCLAAARYYSGLGQEKCTRIDEVLTVPFPAAKPRGR